MAYLSGTGILNLAPVPEDGEHLLRDIVELHNALIELLFSGVADCTNWIRICVCVCVCVCNWDNSNLHNRVWEMWLMVCTVLLSNGSLWNYRMVSREERMPSSDPLWPQSNPIQFSSKGPRMYFVILNLRRNNVISPLKMKIYFIRHTISMKY